MAANAEDVPSALAQCRAQESETARLSCYDQLADRVSPPPAARQQASATPPPVAPAPALEPAAPGPAGPGASPRETTAQAGSREFGYRGGPLARADAERAEAAQAEAKEQGEASEEIVATVTEVARRPRGQLAVTLDNGQTWLQKTADAWFVVKYGDRVRVQAGTLGAYLMYREDSKRGTRVTRIR
jgi:hypothetical protein